MKKEIKEVSKSFLEKVKGRNVRIITHYDTDGITAAAIMVKFLKKINVNFSVKIIKQLEKDIIESLKNKINGDEILVFLDLGSSHIQEIKKLNKITFIIDHHIIKQKIEKTNNLYLLNYRIKNKNEKVCAASLTYLFVKETGYADKSMAILAVIGIVGDSQDQHISKLNNEVIKDAEVEIKKSLMLYPITRPINKTLEFSNIFIPGITGNSKGVLNLLAECGIKKEGNKFKSLIELNKDELSKLITAIILRTGINENDIIGNTFLIKFFNKLEDAREISAMINGCSRMGYPHTALSFCLENEKAKKKAEEIYVKYKQEIISSLNYANQNKIEKDNFIIINGKSKIKDAIIGTICSILIKSFNKNIEKIVVGMAYSKGKIKVSIRLTKKAAEKRSAREILENVLKKMGGEIGGHEEAAGCIINKEYEKEFLENLIKELDVEIVKI